MAKAFQYMLRVSGWEQVAAGVTANEGAGPAARGGRLAELAGSNHRPSHPHRDTCRPRGKPGCSPLPRSAQTL